MKICYIDESGHCGERFNPDQPYEVLCGVLADVSGLFKTQKEHSDIIDYLKEKGIKISELKAAEIYGGRKEWEKLDTNLRDSIYDALIHWSVERKCNFVICPIDSEKFFEKKKSGCIEAKRFHFPWEAGAFNAVLAIQREYRSTKNNKGKTIVVFDEQKKHDTRFLKLFETKLVFTDGYTGYKEKPRAKSPPRFDQIVDVPHFSKSHLAVMIQVADIAAYIVARSLVLRQFPEKEKYDGELRKLEDWLKIIGSRLINHTSIDPPSKDGLSSFYREVRPQSWDSKKLKNGEEHKG